MRSELVEPHLERLSIIAVAVFLAACGDDPNRGGGVNSGIDSANNASTGPEDASEATAGGSNGTEAGPSSGPTDAGDILFDLGLQPDIELAENEGCSKVDFVFVIDDSGSMGDDQDNLTANFGAFITGIQTTLADVDDYQVGVVTTDAYDPNSAQCDTLGGLVIRTGGDDSSNATCGPYADGYNFMTQNDDLPATFACAAQVGTDGSGNERPMNALEIAVRKDLGGPGQCNDAFLRDDALLVAVIITDEYDGPGDPDPGASSGNPASWYDTVVTAKGGIPENVVVLSLLNYEGGPCPPDDLVDDGANIVTFTEMFGANGFLGGICAPDYGPISQQAIGVIANACDNFVPPA